MFCIQKRNLHNYLVTILFPIRHIGNWSLEKSDIAQATWLGWVPFTHYTPNAHSTSCWEAMLVEEKIFCVFGIILVSGQWQSGDHQQVQKHSSHQRMKTLYFSWTGLAEELYSWWFAPCMWMQMGMLGPGCAHPQVCSALPACSMKSPSHCHSFPNSQSPSRTPMREGRAWTQPPLQPWWPDLWQPWYPGLICLAPQKFCPWQSTVPPAV